MHTFFNTLEETLGRGMGWSDSPTSKNKRRWSVRATQPGEERKRTLEHVLDENGALDNLLVGIELLVVGRDEEDHFELWVCEDEAGMMERGWHSNLGDFIIGPACLVTPAIAASSPPTVRDF